jgi:hypothetical protein
MKPYAAEITWRDAASRSIWRRTDDARGDMPDEVITRGTVIHKSTERLVVALNLSSDFEVASDVLVIPAECVRRIRRLR